MLGGMDHGKKGGRLSGLSSAPGCLAYLPTGKIRYLAALGLFVPVIIYMYYVYIESWCLAYTGFLSAVHWNFMDRGGGIRTVFPEFTGIIHPENPTYFSEFILRMHFYFYFCRKFFSDLPGTIPWY